MDSQTDSRQPLFTESESKAHLAWLARGMQRHGQTVCMIEQLQPSWLTRRQQILYTFSTRMLVGLIFGLVLGVVCERLSRILLMQNAGGGEYWGNQLYLASMDWGVILQGVICGLWLGLILSILDFCDSI